MRTQFIKLIFDLINTIITTKIMKLILLIFCEVILLLQCMKLQNKIEPKVEKKPKSIPLYNIHVEEPNREVIERKRIEWEKTIERDRLLSYERGIEEDNQKLLTIIENQNMIIEQLNEIISLNQNSIQHILKLNDK